LESIAERVEPTGPGDHMPAAESIPPTIAGSAACGITRPIHSSLALVHDRDVRRVLGEDARIHQNADLHAGLPLLDDRARVARILHEPQADVDLDGFRVDEVEQRGAAILIRRVAELLACVDAWRTQDVE
jgi:hypothetical protein